MLPKSSTFWIIMVFVYMVVLLGGSGLLSHIEEKKEKKMEIYLEQNYLGHC